MDEEKINVIVYEMYDAGFIAGAKSMIRMIAGLDIVNERMAELLEKLIFDDGKLRPEFPEKEAGEKARQATQKIMGM
jgi:hypothetical protein